MPEVPEADHDRASDVQGVHCDNNTRGCRELRRRGNARVGGAGSRWIGDPVEICCQRLLVERTPYPARGRRFFPDFLPHVAVMLSFPSTQVLFR